MKQNSIILSIVIGCLVSPLMFLPSPANAIDGIERNELSRKILTGKPEIEVITAILRLKPGGNMPRHFHNGDEFLYVLKGGKFNLPGKGIITFKAGSTVHFPRNISHGGFTVVGSETIEVLTTHIVDAGKPLMELIK